MQLITWFSLTRANSWLIHVVMVFPGQMSFFVSLFQLLTTPPLHHSSQSQKLAKTPQVLEKTFSLLHGNLSLSEIPASISNSLLALP